MHSHPPLQAFSLESLAEAGSRVELLFQQGKIGVHFGEKAKFKEMIIYLRRNLLVSTRFLRLKIEKKKEIDYVLRIHHLFIHFHKSSRVSESGMSFRILHLQ